MNPLYIVCIASIETITSPPGCKLFYYAEMSQFLEAVGSNGLPQHAHFPYALAIFSRFGKHCSCVAFGKNHFILKLLCQFKTSSLTYVRGGAPYPSGHSLPLLWSASLSALALVHVLFVAFLRLVCSILLSFASDASPSIGHLALPSHPLLKSFRRPKLPAVLARGNTPCVR